MLSTRVVKKTTRVVYEFEYSRVLAAAFAVVLVLMTVYRERRPFFFSLIN